MIQIELEPQDYMNTCLSSYGKAKRLKDNFYAKMPEFTSEMVKVNSGFTSARDELVSMLDGYFDSQDVPEGSSLFFSIDGVRYTYTKGSSNPIVVGGTVGLSRT